MKNYSTEKWNLTLAKQNWESIGETEDVDMMVNNFTECMGKALDEMAPMRNFTIRPDFKQGISQETKDKMKERDNT